MKKIGIVTITELENFGNRLQNYALQEMLCELGLEVETLRNYIVYKNESTYLWKIKQLIKILLGKKECYYLLVRKKRFNEFDDEYFKFSKFYSTINFISPNIDKYYDYFICGSDQIWNVTFPFNLDFNFLTFAKKNKRISYAASFGISSLPKSYSNYQRKELKEKILGLKAVSVREYQGADIVKELCGVDIPVLIDPTLLINDLYWYKLAVRPQKINTNNKYILKYFLGEDDAIFTKLNNFAVKNNYEIIDLYNKKSWAYTVTPAEFLWLIKNAEIMITDSFHGIVFSIVFNTPFISQERVDHQVSMNSRLDTLFKKIGVGPVNDLDNIDKCRKYNDDEQKIIHSNLNQERDISVNYLIKNLNLDKVDV